MVTAGITAELRRRGINSMPAKPVQTGCVNGVALDLEFALKLSGITLSEDGKRELCPFLFEPACSPHLAAELAGRIINAHELAEKMKLLEDKYHMLVAEGAGGVLVPLGDGLTMLDLMKKLGWPVVLVSCDRLGTINHTLLSISALRRSGIDLAGVVINHAEPPSDLISKSNSRAIQEYGEVTILGEIPFSPDVFPHHSFKEICDNLRGNLHK